METVKVNPLDAYISSLNVKEKQAFDIAKDHLGSLFTVEKNNGYIDWCKKQKVEIESSSSSCDKKSFK